MQERFDIILCIILFSVIAADNNFIISCFGFFVIVALVVAFNRSFDKGNNKSSNNKSSKR